MKKVFSLLLKVHAVTLRLSVMSLGRVFQICGALYSANIVTDRTGGAYCVASLASGTVHSVRRYKRWYKM